MTEKSIDEVKDEMRKILVVVDMQNDFIDGSLGTPEALAIVENVKKRLLANSNYDMCIDYLLFNIWEEINEKNYRS